MILERYHNEMKKLLYLLSSAILALNVVSCREELELVTDQNTAVIIGLLNPNDNVHYVKVTRSFIGDGLTNTYDIAQIPDSSYFNNVNVTVEEILNNNVLRTFQLHDTIIQSKDTNGVFYGPEQKVSVFYTTDASPLRQDCKYRMTAKINNEQFIIQGETDVVNGMGWGNIGGSYNYLTLVQDPGDYKTQIIPVTNVSKAKRLVGEVLFNYYDIFPNGDSTLQTVKVPLGEYDLAEGTNNYNFYLAGATFYETLKNKIPVSSAIDVRRCSNIVINVTAANEVLASYIAVNKPTLSIAQNKPEFTNLKVVKGEKLKVIGIFGSRTTLQLVKPYASVIGQIQAISQNSRRELCIGQFTGNLGFCSWHQTDINNSSIHWSCN